MKITQLAALALGLALASPVLAAPEKVSKNLIPQPTELQLHDGSFKVNSKLSIGISNDSLLPITAPFLKELRNSTGWTIRVAKKGNLQFNLSEKQIDGYKLAITKDSITVTASSPSDVAHAMQTLLQLSPVDIYADDLDPKLAAGWEIQTLEITDTPRFEWRGIHVDVSRKFQTKETIMRLLDSMAMVKLNKLHWHLTDDQGWRPQIAGYPKLTPPNVKSYTKAEMKEVVAYAKSLGITVIPEIDVPGHCWALATAYPKLCVHNPKKNRSYNVCDVTNPDLYVFLDVVMGEMADIFGKGKIHIGADEVQMYIWNRDPKTKKYMKENGIKDTHELQAEFVTKLDAIVRKHQCSTIVWDEAFNEKCSKDILIMSWRGVQPGIAAAKAGHKVVITPVSALYYDRAQSRSKAHRNGYSSNTVMLNQSYFFEPRVPTIDAAAKKNILGAQGCIWGEHIKSADHMQKQAMLRGVALSEALWSNRADLDWNHFLQRLELHRKRLDAAKIPYWWEPATTPQKVASWTETEGKKAIETDITHLVNREGLYEFMFQYKNGEGSFYLRGAELLEDGKVISEDIHNCAGAIEPRRPTQYYKLKLAKKKPGAKYTLRYTVESVKGGCTGVAMMIPPLPSDEYAKSRSPKTKANSPTEKQPDEL